MPKVCAISGDNRVISRGQVSREGYFSCTPVRSDKFDSTLLKFAMKQIIGLNTAHTSQARESITFVPSAHAVVSL